MNRHRGVVAALAAAGLVVGILSGTTEAQADSGLAPLLGGSASAAGVVPNGYIVVLKSGAGADGAKAASVRATSLGGSVGRTYSRGLQGYSATLSSKELAAVRADPAVAYVERDHAFHIDRSSLSKSHAVTAVSASGASYQRKVESWGLDRMDQRKLPLDGAYYSQDNSDAGTVYVVNDGVYDGFTSLDTDLGVDLVGGSTNGDGCQIMGTFIAHLVGGPTYGAAKRAPISSVRVADCDGNGTTSTLIAGLEWVLTHEGLRTGVVDLGIQTPSDQALDDAVTNLLTAGIPVVSGAFHSDTFDACTTSPTEVAGVINVSGTTIKDRAPSSFSATGSCVDIWAPAQDVVSVVPPPPGKGGEWYATGNSPDFAAGYVTGAIVQYKRWEKHYTPTVHATPAQIMDALTKASTKNVIKGVPAGTTSNLAFSKYAVPLPTSVGTATRLKAGQALVRDGSSRLTSPKGTYFLTYRASDGHPCVYTAAGRAHWCINKASAWLAMNSVGTAGTYDGYGQKVWSSGVTSATATLYVNDKGYIYTKTSSGKVTWSSPH